MNQEIEYTLFRAIKGAFSTQAVSYLGFGATKQRVSQDVYVYAEERAGGEIICQPLNANHVPAGPVRILSRDDFLRDFLPEPDLYMNKVHPAMIALERIVDQADAYREAGQVFSAEFEYKNALRVDEEHIRATFGLGLVYLERGESKNGELVFKKLHKLEGAFEPRHKHLFNEFGIKLRKNKLYNLALQHYCKALRLEPTDEHLLCNIARVFYEKGRFNSAIILLEKVLNKRPNFYMARKFLTFLQKSQIRRQSKGQAPARPEGKGRGRAEAQDTGKKV